MISATSPALRPRPSRFRRRARATALAAAVFLAAPVGGELFARYALGLGDPPLVVADPEIAYYFKPSMEYRRFGRTVRYNACGSRSDEFGPTKSAPGELRVLCIGDSVLNGGALTDQDKLATALLQGRLRREFPGRPLYVGNISGGGWGPLNQLAFARKFGLFEADVVVLVLNGYDAWDMPKFGLAGTAEFPTAPPCCALYEGITRYLPRYLGRTPAPTQKEREVSGRDRIAADSPACLKAVGDLIALAEAAGAAVVVAQTVERSEIPPGQRVEGHAMIAAVADRLGAGRCDTGPAFERAIAGGLDPFRDEIHPNELGQSLMAEALFPVVRDALAERARR